ncbi:MAG: leucine-rich repeat domain-containing protein, partial [Paludibacteraceae bacterium]|nr:leucine-rich repeat domain-containing protein [Paludibacteraceae bacterium]
VLERIEIVHTRAFAGCEILKDVEFNENTIAIEEHAFAWCGMASAIFPENLAHIGQYAFVGCNKLRQIVCAPTTPPAISDKSFDKDTFY